MNLLHDFQSLANSIWKDMVIVLSIIWIYEGVRTIVSGNQLLRGTKFLVSGLSLMLIMILIAWWVSSSLNQIPLSVPTELQVALPENWGADSPPETRERNSRFLASFKFTDSGLLTNYFDKKSGWKPYCPTSQDIELRDQSVIAKRELQRLGSEAKSSIFRWLTFGIISALTGIFMGRKARESF
jgi:hypothetical protein